MVIKIIIIFKKDFSHTEDFDLYSLNISYKVDGWEGIKIWIAIPIEHFNIFERACKKTFKDEYTNCAAYIRHKEMCLSIQFFQDNNIPYAVGFQHPGMMVMTFPKVNIFL
jgi:jumonji domain-containing protein 2